MQTHMLYTQLQLNCSSGLTPACGKVVSYIERIQPYFLLQQSTDIWQKRMCTAQYITMFWQLLQPAWT